MAQRCWPLVVMLLAAASVSAQEEPRPIVADSVLAPVLARAQASKAFEVPPHSPNPSLYAGEDENLNPAGVKAWQAELQRTLADANARNYAIAWEDLGGEAAKGEQDSCRASTGANDSPSSASCSSEAGHRQLLDCVNSAWKPDVPMTWNAAMMDETMGHFRALATFWSTLDTDRKPASNVPVTLTTIGSVNRLPQLYAQCAAYAGPLSVALYLPIMQDLGPITPANQAILRDAVLQTAQFVMDVKAMQGSCQPDVLLIYEIFADDLAKRILYPFNALRNLARLQVRTPLMAMIDVDLLPSRGLFERASNARLVQDLMRKAQEDKAVFIIPAFDVHGVEEEKAAWAHGLVTSPKETAVHAFRTGVLFQFASDRGYYQGHGLTNYKKWMTATQDYPVEFETMCEPWLIADRLQLPWSDVRYRGYGFDKVQFIEDIAANGFQFNVLHDAFIIHRAHAKSDARERFLKFRGNEGDEPSLFNHNLNLWTIQTNLHQLGQPFQSGLHRFSQKCLEALPWWNVASQEKP